jgi:hypothetical protein
LSKRVKKQVQDISGLSYLKREQKIERAREILESVEKKQALCNDIPGLNFKDLEKLLKGIIDSKAPAKVPDEPPEVQAMEREVRPTRTTLMLDIAEINRLIHASETPLFKPSKSISLRDMYPYTYSPEETKKLTE